MILDEYLYGLFYGKDEFLNRDVYSLGVGFEEGMCNLCVERWFSRRDCKEYRLGVNVNFCLFFCWRAGWGEG